MNYKQSLALLTLLISFFQSANAAIVASSTFDANLDGWGGVPGEATFISHEPTGGNPGGYIQSIDQGPTFGNILAPSNFLGDWSGFDGLGTLSWDFIMFDAGPNNGNISNLRATLSGPGGSAIYDSGVSPILGSWLTIKAPIEQAAWTLNNGSWASLLANVDELRLEIEPVPSTAFPGEVTGIDNVILTVVPIPGALALFVPAVVGLLAFRRVRHSLY